MPSDAPRCETCRWWYKVLGGRLDGLHECRRYPPVTVPGNAAHWSRPRDVDFCGEHSPRPEEPPQSEGPES
jgi:hypothetical protein